MLLIRQRKLSDFKLDQVGLECRTFKKYVEWRFIRIRYSTRIHLFHLLLEEIFLGLLFAGQQVLHGAHVKNGDNKVLGHNCPTVMGDICFRMNQYPLSTCGQNLHRGYHLVVNGENYRKNFEVGQKKSWQDTSI